MARPTVVPTTLRRGRLSLRRPAARDAGSTATADIESVPSAVPIPHAALRSQRADPVHSDYTEPPRSGVDSKAAVEGEKEELFESMRPPSLTLPSAPVQQTPTASRPTSPVSSTVATGSSAKSHARATAGDTAVVDPSAAAVSTPTVVAVNRALRLGADAHALATALGELDVALPPALMMRMCIAFGATMPPTPSPGTRGTSSATSWWALRSSSSSSSTSSSSAAPASELQSDSRNVARQSQDDSEDDTQTRGRRKRARRKFWNVGTDNAADAKSRNRSSSALAQGSSLKNSSSTDLRSISVDKSALLEGFVALVMAQDDGYDEDNNVSARKDSAVSPPRKGYAPQVVAARLLADGPPEIRTVLCSRPALLNRMCLFLLSAAAWRKADTSGSAPPRSSSSKLDRACERTASVLCACLVHSPAEVAVVLSSARLEKPSDQLGKEKSTSTSGAAATEAPSSDLLRALVRLVPVAPAAGRLLARGVATCVFGSGPERASVTAMHKKSLHFVAGAQSELARLCCESTSAVGRRDCSAFVRTMSELATRAAMLQKKDEDPDERADRHFMSHLGVLSSADYNDDRASLTLIDDPAPILLVVDKAFGLDQPRDDDEHSAAASGDTDLAIAALTAIADICNVVRDGRASPRSSIRRHAHSLSIDRLSQEIFRRAPRILDYAGFAEDQAPLPDHSTTDDCTRAGSRSGRPGSHMLRAAVVDMITALLEVASPATMQAATAGDVALHCVLVRLTLVGASSSRPRLVGHGAWFARVVSLVRKCMSCPQIAAAWLRDDSFVRMLLQSVPAETTPDGGAAVRDILEHVVFALNDGSSPRTPSVPEFLKRFGGMVDGEELSSEQGLLQGNLPRRERVSMELGFDLFEADTLRTASEDRAQEMFLQYQLDNALSPSNGL